MNIFSIVEIKNAYPTSSQDEMFPYTYRIANNFIAN